MTLDLPTFSKHLADHGTVAVERRVEADWLTPPTALPMLGGRVLLESVEGQRDRDRYSFIGLDPVGTVVLMGDKVTGTFFGETVMVQTLAPGEDPLDALKAFQTQFILPVVPSTVPTPAGGVGYLAYEVVRRFEKVNLESRDDRLGVPDMCFIFPAGYLVFDRLTQSQRLVWHAFRAHPETKGNAAAEYARVQSRLDEVEQQVLATPPAPATFVAGEDESIAESGVEFDMTRDEFLAAVETTRDEIIAGEIFQAVLSQDLSVKAPLSGFDAYRRLRSINPSPYMFYLDFEDFELFGASPEVMVRLRDRKLLVKPIAGTRRRPENAADEPAVEADLLADEKELAEHLMLVDLGRNDLGRIAQTGSVLVTRQCFVEKYSHVMHLVSEIQADIELGKDAFDAIRATFPAGTLSGAPKIRAMEIISGLEKTKRGPYGGLVGYFDGLGNFDSCITIRSAVVKDGTLHVRAGAGVVYDSVPEHEYDETINKAAALLAAIGISTVIPASPTESASPAS